MSSVSTKNGTHREREIERLRRAEVSRKQGVEVPRHQRVEDSIEDKEQVGVQHREVVVDIDCCIDGRPLNSGTWRT